MTTRAIDDRPRVGESARLDDDAIKLAGGGLYEGACDTEPDLVAMKERNSRTEKLRP